MLINYIDNLQKIIAFLSARRYTYLRSFSLSVRGGIVAVTEGKIMRRHLLP